VQARRGRWLAWRSKLRGKRLSLSAASPQLATQSAPLQTRAPQTRLSLTKLPQRLKPTAKKSRV
jgi:hypothetical protein